MIAEIGHFALWLSLAVALTQAIGGLVGGLRRSCCVVHQSLLKGARRVAFPSVATVTAPDSERSSARYLPAAAAGDLPP